MRIGTGVNAVETFGGGYRLRLDRGEALVADGVVLAVPAFVAADLVEAINPAMSGVLRQVRYRDMATVTLAYPHHAIPRPLDATGFLVPPTEGRLLAGCTWLPAKWPQLSGYPVSPIRCLISGDRATDATVPDSVLTRRVHDELAAAMGLTAPPVSAVVARWPQAVPEYTVGHQDRLDTIDSALSAMPGLYLTGAGYRGASLARCVAQAYQTAWSVAAALAPKAAVRPLLAHHT
jgi:oxygen-dependent protoporphyrinogen oxidase